MRREVTIVIDAEGSSTLDLAGFQGQGCGDVARAFQGADTATLSQKKREYSIQDDKRQEIRK